MKTLTKLAIVLALLSPVLALSQNLLCDVGTSLTSPSAYQLKADSIPHHASLRGQILGFTGYEARLEQGYAKFMPPPDHRALFCRFDDKLDRKRIPLRMRLGDLETVNAIEQKPGW